MEKKYDWQRYWHKIGDDPRIIDGFLYVWKEFEITSFPFDKISETPGLVLLGEPGMGKSYEIKKIFRTEIEDEDRKDYFNLNSFGDENRLVRKIFESEKIRKWKEESGFFYLYIDSLDEALLNINTLSNLLSDEINELPADRLFLRLACRSAQWSSFSKLNNRIRELWSGEKSEIIQLAPLTIEDVRIAAEYEGQNSEKFFTEVTNKGVGPLAAKPVTLNLLLNIFKETSELPSRQFELYERGCLALSEEDYEDKPASREKDQLTRDQRLRIASRIAAILMFSNKSAIWIGQDTGEQNNADIFISTLLPYTEKNFDGSEFQISQNGVLETIRKGLFKGDGTNRVNFTHQTFAEFLAAWYLDHREISDESVTKIIGQDYVHPQLYETSAWIASKNTSIAKHLLKIAPLVLLRSDVPSEEEFKYDLTERLLDFFENEESFDIDQYQYFQKLNHSRISTQLKPYILDKTKGWVVRNVAINIARSCKVTDLQTEMIELALNKEEVYRIRLNALFSVKDFGNDETMLKLEQLISDDTETDQDIDLKFYALEALWPKFISTQKLFDELDESPRNYSYFLSHTLGEELRKEDLPVALDWLLEKVKREGHLSYDMERLAEEIMLKAWDYLEEKDVLTKFAKISFAYFKTYQDSFAREINKQRGIEDDRGTERRRRVLLETLSLINKDEDWWDFSYSNIFSFRYTDAKWMINEWSESNDALIKSKILYLLKSWLLSSYGYYSSGADPSFLDEVYKTYQTTPVFRDEFSIFFSPIYIDSVEAEESRIHFRKMLEARNKWKMETKEEENLSPSPKEMVLVALTEFEDGDINSWWKKINYLMMFLPNGHSNVSENNFDLTKFPVWKEIDGETKDRIIRAAELYLKKGDPRTNDWIGKDAPYRPADAGYRALCLIEQFEPEIFGNLDKEVWLRWAPAVYFVWPDSGDNNLEKQQKMIAIAYKFVPNAILDAVDKEIDRENNKKEPYLRLYKLDLCWDNELRTILKNRLNKKDLISTLFSQILYKLFELNDRNAEIIACGRIKYPVPEEKKAQDEMLISARLLIQYGKAICWSEIWKILIEDAEYGKELIESAVHGISSGRGEFLRLSEEQTADLFLWLSKYYPQSKDPVHRGSYAPTVRDDIVQWRNSFLYSLVETGTRESVSQILRIKNTLPDSAWLKPFLIDATEKMHEKTWDPLNPHDLLALFNLEDKRARFSMLEEELEEFGKKKMLADRLAHRNARFEAVERLFLIGIVILAGVGIVIYFGWEKMEVWVWIVSICLWLVFTGVSSWYLNDHYFPLLPGKILEREKSKMYEKYKINLLEGKSISEELEKARRELRNIES